MRNDGDFMAELTAQALIRAAGALLGTDVSGAEALAGGDLSLVLRLDLGAGGAAVVKSGPDPLAEAAMLNAIRAAGVAAPRVLAASPQVLVLEDVPNGGGLDAGGWHDLGSALSVLHSSHGARYGWDRDYAFGALRIDNAVCDNWAEFWATRRLLPELARLPANLARRLEDLAADLPNRLPRTPPACLLHGDLWAGNLLSHAGRFAGLIDPACCFGDAEVDLAMLHLFGSPQPAFLEAYGPLEPGVDDRRPLYQIWPAIVHVRLFGASYHGILDGLLRRCGA